MLNAEKSGFDGKLLIAFIFASLLLTSILYSQSNTFKLGVTGAYPNAYGYTVNSGINWSYYTDLNMNTWSGWWT